MFTGSFTPQQLDHIHRVRDDWMRIALSTERCDRPAAEAAVRAAYRAAGLLEPTAMVWKDSPLGGAMALGAIQQEAIKISHLSWGLVKGQLRDQFGGQLMDQLWGQLRDQLWDPFWGQLWDQLWGQLKDQLGDKLWGQLWGQLWSQLAPWYEAYWLGSCTLALSMVGLTSTPLITLETAIRETGWWWPLRGVAILTDRPTILLCDQQGRLHDDTGPALMYADGFGGHYWHGTRVPADLIEGRWDPAKVFTEPNAEIRRCAIERIGWPEFIAAAGLRQVGNTVPDPGNPGEHLALYDLPEELGNLYDEPARILLATNASSDRDGTRRRFGLPVPAGISNPITAAAALFDIPPADYASLVRAT